MMLPAACATRSASPGREPAGIEFDGVALLAYANSTPIGPADIVCSGSIVGDLVITAAHCVRDARRLRFAADPVDLCDAMPEMGTPLTQPWQLPATTADIAIARIPASHANPLRATAGRSAGWSLTGWGSRPGAPTRCTSRTLMLEPATGCQADAWSVCATGSTENTCSGDSGAGVVDSAGRLIAVTSSGVSCDAGAAGSYTRLDALRSWLQKQGLTVGS
jgi:V8-like Glu-specific endopeptidase